MSAAAASSRSSVVFSSISPHRRAPLWPIPSPSRPAAAIAVPARAFSSTPPRGLLNPRDPLVQAMMRQARPLFSSDQARRVARSPSTHAVVLLAFAGALIFYYSNIETVPVSGRQRFNCFSEERVIRASEAEYQQLLRELQYHGVHMLPERDWRVKAVRRVLDRLIPVSGVEGKWELHVIDDPGTANAFVLPGGKVFVCSGIFQYTRNDDALAAVIGHEIAHNLAGHVAERMSQGIGTNILYYSAMLLASFVGALFIFDFFGGGGVLRAVVENPMSRMQENEADQIGLMLMAEACYDPAEAIKFWHRMEQSDVPEWLSTHPSNETRIENLQKWMPIAEDKRLQSDCHGTQGFADMFKRAMEHGEIIRIWS